VNVQLDNQPLRLKSPGETRGFFVRHSCARIPSLLQINFLNCISINSNHSAISAGAAQSMRYPRVGIFFVFGR